MDGEFGADEQARQLLGVGSAPGSGPEAAELARQRALAAVLQQLSARVSAESSSRDREETREALSDGTLTSGTTATTDRERTISVSSAAEVSGARFELASGTERGASVTWALARVDRAELVREFSDRVRDLLDRARDELRAARATLVPPPGAPGADEAAASSASEGAAGARRAAPTDVAPAIVDTLSAHEAALQARALLPLVNAAAGTSTAATRALESTVQARRDDARELEAVIERRLQFGLAQAPPRLLLSGHLGPVELEARWDGTPLAGLPLAARLGDAPPAHGCTDGAGRVLLRVPAPDPPPATAPQLLAAVAVDGRPSALSRVLPLDVPAATAARVVVLTRHERPDESPATVQPSSLQAPLEELLGTLHHPVVHPPLPAGMDVRAPGILAGLAGTADYALLVSTRSAFRSREGRNQQGLLWYGTALEARFVDVTTGEAFTVTIAEADTRDAGATAAQAEERSLARALARLLDRERPDALPALLAARFR